MASLGFWNLIIIAIVTVVLRRYLQGDKGTKYFQDSEFLQHPLPQKILQFFQHSLVKLVLQVATILIIARWLIYTGWVAYRLTQPKAPLWDMTAFYLGGLLAVNRVNLYQPDIFTEAQCQIIKVCSDWAFVYPPNILPLILPLGYLSLRQASTVWVLVHLISIIFLLWGANILLDSNSRLIRIICTIACALIYGVVFDLRAGNISSIVAVLIVWSIINSKKHQDLLAGVLLGISTIKPTISALFFVYFLLKGRWKILSWGILTSGLLTAIGLWLTGNSLSEAIVLYKKGYQWTFEHHHSNNPFISPTRIDLGVLGARLFPNNAGFANFLSGSIVIVTISIIFLFICRWQFLKNWTKEIDLSEVAVISVASLVVLYSQRHNTAILVLAVVFILNYAISKILYSRFSWKSFWLLSFATICLSLQTGVIYFGLLEPLEAPWKNGNVSYLTKVTIGSLPNYSLIVLLVIILWLAELSMSNNKTLGKFGRKVSSDTTDK
jgi:hypothetical protein